MNRPSTIVASLGLGLAATAAQAALPPYWQSVKEIEAIVNDPAVAHALEPNMIDRIETLSPDHFRVGAGRCHADVRIDTIPRGNPGPRQFRVILTDHRCTDAQRAKP